MRWNSLGEQEHSTMYYKIYLEYGDEECGYAAIVATGNDRKHKWYATDEQGAACLHRLKDAIKYAPEVYEQLDPKPTRVEIVQHTEVRLMYIEKDDYEKWVDTK